MPDGLSPDKINFMRLCGGTILESPRVRGVRARARSFPAPVCLAWVGGGGSERLRTCAVSRGQVPFDDPRHYYRVAERVASESGAVWTNQFENLARRLAQRWRA